MKQLENTLENMHNSTSQTIKVLSIDPGVCSGFAYGEIDEGLLTFGADQAKMKCKELWESLYHLGPDHVICESFEFRQGKQRGNLNLYSRNLIGVVTLYHELEGNELYEQTASQGKGFWNNQ